MEKLLNCTAHDQSQFVESFKNFGFDIETKPRIGRVAPDPTSGRVTSEALEKEALRVAAEVPAGSSCLIGGAGVMMERLSIELLRKGCWLYSATSERVTNSNGEFVFNLSDVVETPLSKMYHEGIIRIK